VSRHLLPGARRLRQCRAGRDSGAPDKIEIRQNVAQGGESRVIGLRGVGKRSMRRIDLWYDTQGLLEGKADVTVFGMK
jgi:hypothetical protein